MVTKCRYCGSRQVAVQNSFITSGLCASCAGDLLSTRDHTQRFINSFSEPILFMRDGPRLVVAANRRAARLFGKDLVRIRGLRSGQVFDCIHSTGDSARGPGPACKSCRINKAVKETFAFKKASSKIYKLLEVLRHTQAIPYHLEVSTEPMGDYALLRVERYSQAE